MNQKDLFSLIINNYNSMSEGNRNFASSFWKEKNHYKKINNLSLERLQNFRSMNYSRRLSYGLDDQENFFATLETYLSLLEKCDKKIVDELTEVNIGNPKFYEINNTKINYNELFNINFLFQILKYSTHENIIILEIGGGFGSLSSKLKKVKPKSKVILIDIPESLNLQIYYVKSLYPESKILLYKEFNDKYSNNANLNFIDFFRDYDFIFLPPNSLNRLKKFNRFVDLFINTRSFQEMEFEMIKIYFDFIENTILEGGIFYNCNKYSKFISNQNINFNEYPYSDNWDCISSSVSFNQLNVHELVTRYNSKPIQDFSLILKKIKNRNIKVKKKFFIFKILLRKFMDLIFFFIPKKILFKIFKIYL